MSNDNGNTQAAASLVAELDEMILKGLKYAGPRYGRFPFPSTEERKGMQEVKDGDHCLC
jgi:hypothetical protein